MFVCHSECLINKKFSHNLKNDKVEKLLRNNQLTIIHVNKLNQKNKFSEKSAIKNLQINNSDRRIKSSISYIRVKQKSKVLN